MEKLSYLTKKKMREREINIINCNLNYKINNPSFEFKNNNYTKYLACALYRLITSTNLVLSLISLLNK